MKELVMLSEEEIVYCYEEGVRVKLYQRLPTKGRDLPHLKHYLTKGFYDASENKVSIYLPHILDLVDYKVTLFHELAHAIDDLLFDDKYPEQEIEDIAQKTYQTNPQLFEFIKEMYLLKDTRFEKEK